MGLKIDNGVLLSPDANGNYVERAAFNNDGDLVFKNADGSSKGAGITESAGDLRYLQLLGGTVTGAIHANHTSNTFSGARFSFGSASLEKSGDNNHIHFGGTAIIPLANGGGSIGTSGYRFGGIFSTGANVSGTATLGKAYINGASDNSGKSDFSVYTGGTASLALTGGEFRVGDTDVNWTVALRSSGYLGAYGIAMTIGTAAGDYAIDITPNGTTTASFNQGVTTFHTPITVKGGAPNPETTDGYGLEIMGNYTDGRWNHRFVKHDDGAGVPLYVQKTTSVANVWSNVARFGLYSGNGYEFEVFGAAKVNGDFASTGQINASGGNSANWNTAYGWGNHSGLYLGISAKAADSNLLDGIDSSSFFRKDVEAQDISGYVRINKSWGGGTYGAEAFTIRGTHPSFSLRSTQADYKWLFHTDESGNLRIYTGSVADDNAWTNRFSFTTGNNFYIESGHLYVQSGNVYASGGNSTLWNTAYGWGNHASAGYLTSLPAHTHDDRYYTETEVNTLLAAKSATSHTHNVYDLNNFNSGQDPNTYSQTRIWTSLNGGTAGNYPSAYNGVVNLGMDASHGLQFSYHYGATDDALYFRHKSDNPSAPNGVGWQGWKTLASRQWVQAQGYLTSSGIGSYATQQYVTDSINSLINGAPGALNTLDELAAALGDDANFASTVTTSIAGKVSKSGDTMTGNLTIAQSSGNNTLTINSTGGGTPVIYMNSPTRGWGQFVADNNLRFKDETGNIEVLTLEAGGNVGVGLADPAYKLDVSGVVNASENVRGYGFQGNANVGGTGNASYHPSGIYSAGYNWLYGGGNFNAGDWSNMGNLKTYDSSDGFWARYNAGNDNYAATLFWNTLQLGNNGQNVIYVGKTNAGGYLDIYTNVTEQRGTAGANLAMRLHATGRVSINSGTDSGYGLTVGGGLYVSGDWVRVEGNQGIYFQSYGGGWRMSDSTWIRAWNDKSIYTGGTVQAARFEDANDSAYYLDPNGTSNLAVVNVNTINGTFSNSSSYDSSNNLLQTPSGIKTTSAFLQFTGGAAIAPHGLFRTSHDWPAPYGIGWSTGGESSGIFQQFSSNGYSLGDMTFYINNDGLGRFKWVMRGWEGTSYNGFGSNNYSNVAMTLDDGYNLTAYGSMRAPIFYDSNDTNFYVNPAGESVLSRLNAGGSSHTYENSEAVIKLANTVNAHNYIVSNGNAWSSWNQWIRYVGGYNTWRIGTYDEAQESGISVWRLAGRNRSSNSELNYIVAGPRGSWGSDDRVILYNPYARYDGGSYNGDGTLYALLPENKWIGNKYFASDGRIYGTIFYDANDSNYYVDPNNTSNLNFLNLGNTREEFPLLRMGAGGRYAIGVSGAHTRISSHNQGSGVQLGSYDGTTFTPKLTVSNDGNVSAESSLRAPIFYDSQDTSYYVDPNSGSRLRHLYVGDVAGSNDGTWNARMKVIGSNHARLDVVSNSDGIITTMFAHTGNGAGKMGTWSNHPLKLVIDGNDKATLDSSGNFTVVGRFTETSSQKYKTNIQDLGPTLEKVDQLRGVTYSKIGSEETEIGMIAEEVAQIFPDLISYNEEGQIESLNYTRITAVLVEAVKELNAKVKTQEIFIDNIVARLERLENK